MDLKIIKNERNEAFRRAEILAELKDKKIPSKEEIKKNITAQLNTDKEKVIIESIIKEFGKEKILVTARVYDDINKMKEIESKYLLTRNEEKKKEGEESSEEVTPTEKEEAKEETKTEEKPKEEDKKEKKE
jgi:small subunit ribosomal protein S24e